MPWATVYETKLAPYPQIAHSTNDDPSPCAPPGADSRLYIAACTRPEHALRTCIAKYPDMLPPCVVQLLFMPLESVIDDNGNNTLNSVLDLVRSGTVAKPTRDSGGWMPYGFDENTNNNNYRIYTALVLRVHILERMCIKLRSQQRRHDAALYDPETGARRRRTRRKKRKKGGGEEEEHTTIGVQSTESYEHSILDETSHWMHRWLDAHLLLCCTYESHKVAERDDSIVVRESLLAYTPSASTVFHEGEMPNLTRQLEMCSFFGDTTGRVADPVVHMMSKVPFLLFFTFFYFFFTFFYFFF